MDKEIPENYKHIRGGGAGFFKQKRGLISVWGKEAVQFLDGLISNDMKTLADGEQMLAAFPNAQGRLLAVVRVLRHGDRFLFETEEATRNKVFQNLFRFTFAGDFFVEDLSDNYLCVETFRAVPPALSGVVTFTGKSSAVTFAPLESSEKLSRDLTLSGSIEITDDLYEIFRIENGIPRYGVDMDETTIVPELGLDGLISYKKGCYIGQEIIARIYFRGHVAKRLTGLVLSERPASAGETEAQSVDGKNAGRMTSITFSPKLGRWIALAYVRYEHLADGTSLTTPNGSATVTDLPFVAI